MLLTIADFRRRVAADLPSLIAALQETTGRFGSAEADAWRASFPVLSAAFQDPLFQPLHLYFENRGNLSLEYRLPASSSWCDLVLLGAHANRPSAAIVELKHWDTIGDRAGPVEALVDRHGTLELHPSDQVRGYVEYCRHFHSAVNQSGALVHGCVLFTRGGDAPAYSLAPHDLLTRDYPCFSGISPDGRNQLFEYFASRLSEPDPHFAAEFEAGWYEQDRSFVRGIGESLARSSARPLVLLDNQRFGFALTKAEVEKALFGGEGGARKKVVIVEGPPGSGKSIVAAKVWASIAADDRFEAGRFVLTTTSTAQETNWKHLVRSVVGHHGAGGIVLPANKYAPAPLQELIWWKERRPGVLEAPAHWRHNLNARQAEKGEPWMPDDHLLLSIVDEAHALINPERPRAVTHSGWPNPFGPQAYHIIRASRVSVFFLDPEQRFRERESTTTADIETWSKELGADEVIRISLAGAQFRCAGSTEYVSWVEALLSERPNEECAGLAQSWMPGFYRTIARAAEPIAESGPSSLATTAGPRRPASFEFVVCDTPAELESMLRSKLTGNQTGRLIASFARPWITQNLDAPHEAPPHQQDFCFRWREAGRERTWARPWNVIPRNDYSSFIQAVPGTRIAQDQLSEVGCTYAVRGFDFDYVGILWLGDLSWRSDQWTVDLPQVFETGLRGTLKSASRKKNPDAQARAEVLERVKQAYRILLTRAIKGVFVWCEDAATAARLRAAQGLLAEAPRTRTYTVAGSPRV